MDVALASLGARAGAAVDHLLAAIPAVAIGGLALVFSDTTIAVITAITSAIVVTIAYFTVFEARNGATPIKDRLGLRVVQEDGSEIAWRHAAIRNIVRPIDFSTLYLTGIGFIMASGKSQRLGDRLAGTIVVEEGEGAIIEEHEVSHANQAVGYLIAVVGLLPALGPLL